MTIETRLAETRWHPAAMVMPRHLVLRLVFGVSLWSGCFSGQALAQELGSLLGVWQKVSTYLPKEALQELNYLPQTWEASGQREHEFCSAVVQLAQQPLSEDRLDIVERRLKALLDAGLADEIDSVSRYLLGRIAQIYRAKPNVTLAAGYYRELIHRAGPGHWADIARVKLAVLILYALPAANTAERIVQAEALIPGTADPLAVRDLHRVVGRAVMFYNFHPADALRHLLAADKIGGLNGTLAADQLVQIGELAWDTGDEDLAKKYYARLREEYPRDPRIFLMDQRIAGNPVPQRSEKLHGR